MKAGEARGEPDRTRSYPEGSGERWWRGMRFLDRTFRIEILPVWSRLSAASDCEAISETNRLTTVVAQPTVRLSGLGRARLRISDGNNTERLHICRRHSSRPEREIVGHCRGVWVEVTSNLPYVGPMSEVPDFTLIDQAGEPWTLSEQRGHAVVLLFLRGDW
jgi:hypothetical protein